MGKHDFAPEKRGIPRKLLAFACVPYEDGWCDGNDYGGGGERPVCAIYRYA